MNAKSLVLKTCATAAFGLLSLQASAATLTLNYDISFGQTSPDGSSPWMTAVFDDGGSAGSVTLTMTLAGTVGIADIDQVYFNLDDTSFDVTNLSFAYAGTTGPAATSISLGSNSYQADGDGIYDIWMNFPTESSSRWEAGEIVVYDITSTDLITAGSFNVFAEVGGGHGPFISAAHVLSTGGGEDSDWIAAVPVPAAVWLFGSGLLGLVGVARRKRA